MEDHQRYFTVIPQPVLIWCWHHSAAVIPTVHRGSQPDFSVCSLFSVHGHNRIPRLEIKQQSFYGDCGVVDRFRFFTLFALFTECVPDLAAVPVNPEAHIVEEQHGLPIDGYTREICHITVDREFRIIIGIVSEIPCKIIAGATGEIIEFVSDFDSVCVVHKAVQRPVSAADNNSIVLFHPLKENRIPGDTHHVNHNGLRITYLKHFRVLFASAIVCVRIIQDINVSHFLSPLLGYHAFRIRINSSPVMVSCSYRYCAN